MRLKVIKYKAKKKMKKGIRKLHFTSDCTIKHIKLEWAMKCYIIREKKKLTS